MQFQVLKLHLDMSVLVGVGVGDQRDSKNLMSSQINNLVHLLKEGTHYLAQ